MDGIAHFTQSETAERLKLGRMGVQEAIASLVKHGFISRAGAGRIWVNDQKTGSTFHRRPIRAQSPQLEARILASAETSRKKSLAGRKAYRRKVTEAPGHPMDIDPDDVPEWK
jgi:DNA-binding IclR family transcriptional regulator